MQQHFPIESCFYLIHACTARMVGADAPWGGPRRCVAVPAVEAAWERGANLRCGGAAVGWLARQLGSWQLRGCTGPRGGASVVVVLFE